MRVNTLSPEGTCKTHWSTPDKVPHQAMWLWDSCFHAIGRQVVEPDLAWEYVVAALCRITRYQRCHFASAPHCGQNGWSSGAA